MFAQDRLVVRAEPDEEKGLIVFLGAEFYPPLCRSSRRLRPWRRKKKRSSPSWRVSRSLLEPNPPPAQAQESTVPAKLPRLPGNMAPAQRRQQVRRPRKEETRVIQRITPPGLPEPRGPYSPVVRAGDFLFVSGQGPVDPATNQFSSDHSARNAPGAEQYPQHPGSLRCDHGRRGEVLRVPVQRKRFRLHERGLRGVLGQERNPRELPWKPNSQCRK